MKQRLSKKLRENIIRCLMCDDYELGFIAAVHGCTRCQFERMSQEIERKMYTPLIGKGNFEVGFLFGCKISRDYHGRCWVHSSYGLTSFVTYMLKKFKFIKSSINENTTSTSSIT